jgi:two-component system CheB/CheR fusion protein
VDRVAAQRALMTPTTVPSLPFPVVAVGASAGGLTPIERFFANVPASTGAAFVLIQHLSPDFKSMMGDLLARRTSMPIQTISDGVPLRPDHVYLNPPRTNVRIENGVFRLEEVPAREALRPIDVFFESLAEAQGTEAAVVILSGTGNDGTVGIDAIKRNGGLVVVQDEATAEFGGMPRSALATGSVDSTLRPEEMPAFILEALELERDDGHRIRANDVIRLLATKEGVDFSHYKVSTLMRRLERRIAASGEGVFAEYMKTLEASKAERRTLVSDLLIGVTDFFRDEEVWKLIENEIVPKVIADAERGRPVRLWVPACSTGEEAYTYACLLSERMERLQSQPDVKIFATDINPRALEIASAGIYSQESAERVPEGRRSRLFEERDGAVIVRRNLREMVIFARHNLVRDPPFTRMDLVSCRNCLIYLRPSVQTHALASLHYAMRSDGFLVLGPAETVTSLDAAFIRYSEKHSIYRRAPGVRSYLRRSVEGVLSAPRKTKTAPEPREVTTVRRGYRFAAEQLIHAALLLDQDRAILHTIGEGSRYLRIPSGAATLDAQRLVLPELEVALAAGIHRATRTGEAVEYDPVALEGRNEAVRMSIHSIPPSDDTEEALTFIRFESVKLDPDAVPASKPMDGNANRRVRDLEEALQEAREHLQTTIEERESANEELVATNEELMASNEELQATNEELQSVNEELYTVNAEHQSKIAELIGLSSDFDNLLRSLEVGVVFTDRELKIRRFTPAAKGLVNIVEHDLGRPLDHLTHTIQGEDIIEPARRVIADGTTTLKEVQAADGRYILLRVLPFYNHRGETAGSVITFVDTTAIRSKETAIDELQNRLADAHERLRELTGESAALDILLVEDSAADAKLAEIALGKVDMKSTLTVATTGEEALKILREGKKAPDLILLDLNLPDRDGHELLGEMRQDANLATIPVAIVSASAEETDVARAYANRATFYVQKPITKAQLAEVMRRAVAFYTSLH